MEINKNNNAANLEFEGFPELKRYSDIPDPPPAKVYNLNIRNLNQRLPQTGLAAILGPAGDGKSTLARQFAFQLNVGHGARIALTCFEEPVKWRTTNAFQKMYWSLLGKNFRTDGDVDGTGEKWINDNVVFLVKQRRKLLNGWRLMDIVEEVFIKDAADVVIIDPFNEIDHSWDQKKGNKTDYIAEFLMSLKDIASVYKKLIIICCHPPATVVRTKRLNKRPFYEMSDAAESNHFHNKCDVGICCWQDRNIERFVVNFDKVKDTESWGQRQGYSMTFNQSREQFSVDQVGWSNVYGDNE